MIEYFLFNPSFIFRVIFQTRGIKSRNKFSAGKPVISIHERSFDDLHEGAHIMYTVDVVMKVFDIIGYLGYGWVKLF